ncbi:MAG: bifunctional ADP-heptose synthase [Bacteroidales bacterium]
MDQIKIFDSFNRQKALIIGDVMVDAYLWGRVDRISPEAPVPVVSVEKRASRLGGAANVALNVKALGAEPIPCAVIGNDRKGDEFTKLLQKRNISAEGIIASKYRHTTTKFRVIGNNTQMLRVDEETIKELNEEEEQAFIDNCKNVIQKTSPHVIIFEDYDKGLITPHLIQTVEKLAEQMKIPVVADPKINNFLNYRNLSLFKPNLKELELGLKLDAFHSFKEIEKAVFKVQDMQGHQMVMVTMSEDGLMMSNGREIFRVPAHYRSIADVSGAGDTVVAVAALCLAQKLDMRTIAAISNLAGGLVCEQVGVIPIDKKTLSREVNRLL